MSRWGNPVLISVRLHPSIDVERQVIQLGAPRTSLHIGKASLRIWKACRPWAQTVNMAASLIRCRAVLLRPRQRFGVGESTGRGEHESVQLDARQQRWRLEHLQTPASVIGRSDVEGVQRGRGLQ